MIDQYAYGMVLKGKGDFDSIRTNLILHHASALIAKKRRFDKFIDEIMAQGTTRTISCGSARISPGFDYLMAKNKVPSGIPFILASTTLKHYANEHHCYYDERRIGGRTLNRTVIIPDYMEDPTGLKQMSINSHALHDPLLHAKLKLAIVQRKLLEISHDHANEPVEYYFIDDDVIELIFAVLQKHLYVPNNIRVNFVLYSHYDYAIDQKPKVFYQHAGNQFTAAIALLTTQFHYDSAADQLLFTCHVSLITRFTSQLKPYMKLHDEQLQIILDATHSNMIRQLLHCLIQQDLSEEQPLIEYFIERASDSRNYFGACPYFSRHHSKSAKLSAAFYELMRTHHQLVPVDNNATPPALHEGRLKRVMMGF